MVDRRGFEPRASAILEKAYAKAAITLGEEPYQAGLPAHKSPRQGDVGDSRASSAKNIL